MGTQVARGINGAAVVGGISFPPGATRTHCPAIRDYMIQRHGLGILQKRAHAESYERLQLK